MSSVRADHTATLLLDGTVLIAGGLTSTTPTSALQTAELYVPRMHRFILTGSMHLAHCGAAATRLNDGSVLITGGWTASGVTSEAEIYDPHTHLFSLAAPMSMPRASHTSTLLRNGLVLIAGGESTGSAATHSAEVFDPKTRSFAPAGSLHAARELHVAVLLKDGNVLIAGGENADADLASAELFDPGKQRFYPIGDMTTARSKAAAVGLRDGKVLIVGGQAGGPWSEVLKSSELFDPSSHHFIAAADMHEPRYKISDTALLLPNGNIFIGGGATSAEIYNEARNEFTIVPGSLLLDRHFATATLLTDGSVLVAGGYSMAPPKPRDTDTAVVYLWQ